MERIALLLWRKHRLAKAEAAQITNQNEQADEDPFVASHLGRTLPFGQQYLIGRYQGLLGRQIRDTLRDLRDEQDRRFKIVEARGNSLLEDKE